jgi:hypothetical protein
VTVWINLLSPRGAIIHQHIIYETRNGEPFLDDTRIID